MWAMGNMHTMLSPRFSGSTSKAKAVLLHRLR